MAILDHYGAGRSIEQLGPQRHVVELPTSIELDAVKSCLQDCVGIAVINTEFFRAFAKLHLGAFADVVVPAHVQTVLVAIVNQIL